MTNWRKFSSVQQKQYVFGLYLHEVNTHVLHQYKEHYLEMHGSNPVPIQPQRRCTRKSALCRLGSLTWELSDDEADKQDRSSSVVTSDLGDCWQKDFDGYLGSKDQLEEMTLIEWWGAHTLILSFDVSRTDYGQSVECYVIWCLGLTHMQFPSDHGIVSF